MAVLPELANMALGCYNTTDSRNTSLPDLTLQALHRPKRQLYQHGSNADLLAIIHFLRDQKLDLRIFRSHPRHP